ncbi:VWA domain-containing protein [soil metagenome]
MTESDSLTIETRLNRSLVSNEGDEVHMLIRVTNLTRNLESAQRAPVDVAFVLDRSGSMGGGELDAAKAGLNTALQHLGDADRGAVVVYDDRVDVLAPLQPLSHAAKSAVHSALNDVDARGSTDLCGGWLKGCQQLADAPAPADSHRRRKRAILLTDGLANQGETDPAAISKHASELRKRGITTTTLGFGRGFDEQLLAAMAEAGGGNFEYIAEVAQLTPFFRRELGDMLAASVLGFSLAITLPPGIRAEFLGSLPAEREGKTIRVTAGDLGFGETIELLFRVTSRRGLYTDRMPIQIAARWFNAERDTYHDGSHSVELRKSTADEISRVVLDETVESARAIWQSSVDRRRAMELDRAGHHEQARKVIFESSAMMAAAPQTVSVRSEQAQLNELMDANWESGLDTEIHKRVMSRESRRTRGRDVDRPETP